MSYSATSKNPKGSKITARPSFAIVDNETALSEMIDILVGLPMQPPSIYVDLEGIKLSRHGSISILQLYISPNDHTYLIDVHRLQHIAFSTPGRTSAKSLKAILEAEDIPKVFFDVCNDSDALFHHFHISLAGIHDIQLMELATRRYNRQRVNGLQRCITDDAAMTVAEKLAWTAAKDKGMKCFLPEKGGSYEVFNDRPLSHDIVQYCVQDVRFLPRLWARYNAKMRNAWAVKVRAATEERISSSQSKDYVSHGSHKALAPADGILQKLAYSNRERSEDHWLDDALVCRLVISTQLVLTLHRSDLKLGGSTLCLSVKA